MPTASVISRTSRATTVDEFRPQLQETQLTAKAVLDLPKLKKHQHLETLQKHLEQAAKYLTDSAGDINDTAFQERTRHQNKVARLKNLGEKEPSNEKEEFERFQRDVEQLTKRMDESIKQVVDDKAWHKSVPAAIEHTVTKSNEAITRSERRPQQNDGEGDEDEDNRVAGPDASENATALLQAAQSTAETKWKSMTLEERYANNPDYNAFYKIVWEAKNQGEHGPPVPHQSLWFAEEDSSRPPRASQKSQRMPGEFRKEDEEMDDSGDEIQIASEQKRLTCPLTLRPFEEPVTSLKCPHSFEKGPILEMIRRSQEYLPWTPEQSEELSKITRAPDRRRREAQIGTKVVRCPESGCEARISENDLQSDPPLLRRVKRFQEAKRRQKEAEDRAQQEEHDIDDEDNDDDIPRGTQRRRIVNVGSSPAPSRRQTLVKGERLSVVPQTQLGVEELDDE